MTRPATALLILSLTSLAMARTASDSSGVNWISAFGTGCTGSSFQLSAFSGIEPRNIQGGNWYTYTDKSAYGTSAGLSVIKVDSTTSSDGIAVDQDAKSASITATLDRSNAAAHPLGGWAGLGTRFVSALGSDTTYSLLGLKAFSFTLAIRDSSFDRTNLAGIVFKIGNAPLIVGDSVPFHAGIGTSLLPDGQTIMVCVDLAQFKQPTWYKTPLSSMPLTIGKFAWELQLKDIALKSTPSTFTLGEVKLWGTGAIFDPDIIVCAPFRSSAAARATCMDPKLGISPNTTPFAFSARYAQGLVLNYTFDGASTAKIEVLRLDGTKVAAFTHGAQASNLSLPLNLARGTYLAVVQSGSRKLVAPFAVTQ